VTAAERSFRQDRNGSACRSGHRLACDQLSSSYVVKSVMRDDIPDAALAEESATRLFRRIRYFPVAISEGPRDRRAAASSSLMLFRRVSAPHGGGPFGVGASLDRYRIVRISYLRRPFPRRYQDRHSLSRAVATCSSADVRPFSSLDLTGTPWPADDRPVDPSYSRSTIRKFPQALPGSTRSCARFSPRR